MFQHLVMIEQQLRAIEQERPQELRESCDESVEIARRLMGLRGIGTNSAWLYSMELFSWREILLIALWHFLESGEIPKGAELMDWRTKLRCRGGRLVVSTP